ncbi:hypothetical protein [Leucobacter chironomi]|uniref:hypothetical protein n=1 Tax=Leucobacter chironomi TaxID=491918 RepID=UPI000410B83A|nr:hypothetical protein [Leucobacter chironomi]
MRTETLRLLSVLPLAELVELAGDPAPATVRPGSTGHADPVRPSAASERVEDDPATVGCPG